MLTCFQNERLKNISFGNTIKRFESKGRLNLAVHFTPSTPNRQHRNKVCWNICVPAFRGGVDKQSRDLIQNKMAERCFMYWDVCITWFSLEYFNVPSFTYFRWLFWPILHSLKLLNQVRPWWGPTKHTIQRLKDGIFNPLNSNCRYVLWYIIKCASLQKKIVLGACNQANKS